MPRLHGVPGIGNRLVQFVWSMASAYTHLARLWDLSRRTQCSVDMFVLFGCLSLQGLAV